MTDPFVGQINIHAFNFAPYQFALANGQTLAIAQNTTLFSLIGIYFGGNGTTTFQLPNLASRIACGAGTGIGLSTRELGETFGEFAVSLLSSEMPAHSHRLNAFLPNDSANTSMSPVQAGLGSCANGTASVYAQSLPNCSMNGTEVQPTGGNMPHDNVQPYQTITYAIALYGEYPNFS